MKIKEFFANDCSFIETETSEDENELNVKEYTWENFLHFYVYFAIKEIYYSVSKKYTLRGLHSQLPPHAISKLVILLEVQ